MRGLVRISLACCLLLTACAGRADGTASPPIASSSGPVHATIPVAGDALIWGDGPYGLVLLHPSQNAAASWSAQAPALAADRMTVVAPERATGASLRAVIGWLMATRGVPRVAVMAAGDGAVAVVAVEDAAPQLIDQAILISPPGGLDWRAQFPKLFAASRGEAAAAAARDATDQAAGTWNVLLEVGGSASGQAIFASSAGSDLLNGILRRLDERR
jgi:hypothetical protein